MIKENTHRHTHTHTHIHDCFCELWGHSIGVMVCILYKPYFLSQSFSKSGLRSASGPGGNSIRTRLHLIFQAHSYHSDLRAAYVAHTHGRMNQCCSVYRLFCKTKHIATSDIFYERLLSFSRIMSPVSPREREVSPSRRSLSPPAELAACSKNRTEPQQTSE